MNDTNKIMEIDFKENETQFKDLQDLFNTLGQDALYLTHYELAERTGESPISWKKFLMDPRVAAFIAEEMAMLEKIKAAVMLSTVDTNKNTGQAQLLNTLLNRTKGSNKKEGPVFIYTQVPLNKQEQGAANVVIYNEDNAN
jgi:hypothetical protein